MKSIFETCEPRPDVLTGELTGDMFAARLRDVVEGNSVDIYQDAAQFFTNTYPTDGLKTLIREVLGRLSEQEPSNSPFIRLETSFGGGKTHNLIALYHLARREGKEATGHLIPSPEWLPNDKWAVAGVVGSDLDPTQGIDHGDINTKTVWGELAWQLGRFGDGPEQSYELMRRADEALTAPGSQVLERIIGEQPTLIMLDEIARHLRAAKSVSTENGRSDLAEQTVAFLMTLIEFAAGRRNVSVVMTLADSSDAFGAETDELRQELAEMQRIAARHERVLTPTGESEIARIVTHRLFESIDRDAAKETVSAYQELFETLDDQQIEIPDNVHRAEYRDNMIQDYPFHPELLTTLNRKTSTIPHFQKTRGALRLLARVVQRLWEEKPDDTWLIAPYHIDLADEAILNDLTSRLQRPAFRSVVEADIASPREGSPAHAETLDQEWTEAGKPPYARRVATTIFLNSLTQGIATGIELPELFVAVLEPGDEPELVKKTLSRALGEERAGPGMAFWFLHWDGRLYLFKTEPSLEKVIQDEIPQVGRVRAKDELDERIRKVWRPGTFKPVYFPAEASELPDDSKDPKLAVIHYDSATIDPDDEEPPDLIRKLFDRAGTAEGFRTYKNNVLFLAADSEQVNRMADRVQRHLAIQRILSDSTRLDQFSSDQQKKLKSMDEAADLEVRVAITRAYRYLFYPSSDAPAAAGGLARETLPTQGQGQVSSDQTAVVLELLRQLEKVLTADDSPISGHYVRSKAWPSGQESLSTEDLQREFAKRIGLKILLDVNQLKKSIKNGCQQGTWIYYDADEQWGYGPNSPVPGIRFSEDTSLYLPEEAERVGIRIKGEDTPEAEPCPICGQVECECGIPDGTDHETVSPDTLQFDEEGSPGQVFQKIADIFHDEGRDRIGQLAIRCEGTGSAAMADTRALGLAVPQLPKGDYHVRQEFNAEFGEGSDRESFTMTFDGSWDRYKRIKSTVEALGQDAANVSVRTRLDVRYPTGLPIDGDDFQTLRDVLTTLELGRLRVEGREAASNEGES